MLQLVYCVHGKAGELGCYEGYQGTSLPHKLEIDRSEQRNGAARGLCVAPVALKENVMTEVASVLFFSANVRMTREMTQRTNAPRSDFFASDNTKASTTSKRPRPFQGRELSWQLK